MVEVQKSLWPFTTWALFRRSVGTYTARPERKAWPRGPSSSLGSRSMVAPKSAMRTENVSRAMSISTKCLAAKPLPPVTTHHFSSIDILSPRPAKNWQRKSNGYWHYIISGFWVRGKKGLQQRKELVESMRGGRGTFLGLYFCSLVSHSLYCWSNRWDLGELGDKSENNHEREREHVAFDFLFFNKYNFHSPCVWVIKF